MTKLKTIGIIALSVGVLTTGMAVVAWPGAQVKGGAREKSTKVVPAPLEPDRKDRIDADPGSQLAPLLSMRGNIAIDIGPRSFRTRSYWSISSIRGTTRTLELRLHPKDELLDVEVDGQRPQLTHIRSRRMIRLTIRLPEPLRIDPPIRLVMTTRRPLSSPRITFGGFPLTHAKEQSGALAIMPGANLWIDQSAGRALRRIDPWTELPEELRSRPNTVLAYRFFDQPFELNLVADQSNLAYRFFDQPFELNLVAHQSKNAELVSPMITKKAGIHPAK
jgi:hypothetical protein